MEKWPNCENKAINDMILKADFLKGPVRHNNQAFFDLLEE